MTAKFRSFVNNFTVWCGPQNWETFTKFGRVGSPAQSSLYYDSLIRVDCMNITQWLSLL